ncbi:unnamed protein product (macronuclear) [Paramecium tetraurelia]|uniref:Uncharacterized protein n=1 Tax=Paramecium tetraurelia TaxID=5888 RepID=A0DCU0_PARTE|nr:uncharacterized protein GSPATT00015716001 [Paramecium tetraurelia]CAK80857.1 unnamed protein product [Paramecium tetraurelia]|eukprot:XP_001448254.1 hypothetical protein (macronuclear) [Paramecium tetraurelia strain d4-2]
MNNNNFIKEQDDLNQQSKQIQTLGLFEDPPVDSVDTEFEKEDALTTCQSVEEGSLSSD